MTIYELRDYAQLLAQRVEFAVNTLEASADPPDKATVRAVLEQLRPALIQARDIAHGAYLTARHTCTAPTPAHTTTHKENHP